MFFFFFPGTFINNQRCYGQIEPVPSLELDAGIVCRRWGHKGTRASWRSVTFAACCWCNTYCESAFLCSKEILLVKILPIFLKANAAPVPVKRNTHSLKLIRACILVHTLRLTLIHSFPAWRTSHTQQHFNPLLCTTWDLALAWWGCHLCWGSHWPSATAMASKGKSPWWPPRWSPSLILGRLRYLLRLYLMGQDTGLFYWLGRISP